MVVDGSSSRLFLFFAAQSLLEIFPPFIMPGDFHGTLQQVAIPGILDWLLAIVGRLSKSLQSECIIDFYMISASLAEDMTLCERNCDFATSIHTPCDICITGNAMSRSILVLQRRTAFPRDARCLHFATWESDRRWTMQTGSHHRRLAGTNCSAWKGCQGVHQQGGRFV